MQRKMFTGRKFGVSKKSGNIYSKIWKPKPCLILVLCSNNFQISWRSFFLSPCSRNVLVYAWSSCKLVSICSFVAHIFSIFFFQLQTIENVEELRALFASSDGMDIFSHIGLRSIPSRADMTCKQVVLRYLTISYQHCYCRCKGNIFFILGLICFCVNVFFF